ncbi:MAG: hypothetical protein ACLRMJ_10100 [Alistipes finegoldii]
MARMAQAMGRDDVFGEYARVRSTM